jgi:hypothetical protein
MKSRCVKMADVKNKNQQGNTPVDDPVNEAPPSVEYTQLIEQHAFLGTYPFDVIMEGIQKQFEDYINMDDPVNYVDIFYNQLHASHNKVQQDDGEEHPNEIKEVLDRIYLKFVGTINNLFNQRIAIGITPIEEESLYSPDLEFIIRRLYEFFILNAKTNFKVVIASNMLPSLNNIGDDDNQFFKTVQELIDEYNPLISSVPPMKFLQYRGDQDICDLFENGIVTGNFLRKYTPKLYQNEDFQVEIVNYITMIHQFKGDMSNIGNVNQETAPK